MSTALEPQITVSDMDEKLINFSTPEDPDDLNYSCEQAADTTSVDEPTIVDGAKLLPDFDLLEMNFDENNDANSDVLRSLVESPLLCKDENTLSDDEGDLDSGVSSMAGQRVEVRVLCQQDFAEYMFKVWPDQQLQTIQSKLSQKIIMLAQERPYNLEEETSDGMISVKFTDEYLSHAVLTDRLYQVVLIK